MLREYLYIDRSRLKSYAEQIGATMATEKRPQWKVVLGLTGPSVEGQQAATSRAANDHELIESVTSHLHKTGQLRTSRPVTSEDAEKGNTAFVLESMKARKVVFQCDGTSTPRGLREVAVWVSNPEVRPSQRIADKVADFDASGMFVYLLEGYWDDTPTQHAYSIMTALNVLLSTLRTAVGKRGSGIDFDTSRDDYANPVDILVRNGGVKGEQRAITALYRVRAVSENKVVNVGGRTLRCFDLFGYPICIAVGADALGMPKADPD
jgi:hypothetical protein